MIIYMLIAVRKFEILSVPRLLRNYLIIFLSRNISIGSSVSLSENFQLLAFDFLGKISFMLETIQLEYPMFSLLKEKPGYETGTRQFLNYFFPRRIA